MKKLILGILILAACTAPVDFRGRKQRIECSNTIVDFVAFADSTDYKNGKYHCYDSSGVEINVIKLPQGWTIDILNK